MNDDDEFLPYEEDSNEEEEQTEVVDVEAGFTSGAETDAEGEEDLFPDGADPLAMLQGMEENRENDEGNQLQPYELLARQRRLNRHRDLPGAAVRMCSSLVFVGLGQTKKGNTSC